MSRNLHNTDYIFQPKRGLASDLNSTANKNSAVDGELAYTTDRKQLNIYNGTEFEEVNKYTQYFFNSSGSQSGNRFNDFADMIDSIDGREVRVQFEQDETLPAGAFDVSYQTWVGNGNNPDSGGLTITFETGTTFSDMVNWQCENGLTITSNSANPVAVFSTGHTLSFDRCNIEATVAPFFQITGAGMYVFGLSNGFGFIDSGATIVHVDSSAGAYQATIVITRQGIAPVFEDETVSSDVPVVYGWLIQSSEARSGQVTNTGIAAGSIDFASEGGLFSNAFVIGFIEGQPEGINPNNVGDALQQLALNQTKFETFSTTTVLTDVDATVEADTADTTFTLPTAVGALGKRYEIINTSDGDVTVDTTSSEVIGNIGTDTSIVLASGEVLQVVSNDTKWLVI